jgi:hypothetical protein
MSRALFGFVFAASLAACAPVPAAEPDRLLSAALAHAVEHTAHGLPVGAPPLRWDRVSRFDLEAAHVARLGEAARHASPVGWFDGGFRIYVRSDLSGVVLLSVLIHEAVHYLQAHSADPSMACRGAREAEAYRVQEAYLAARGIRLDYQRAQVEASAELCAVLAALKQEVSE